MSISTSLGLLSALLLAIWHIPVFLKWTSFFLSRAAVPYGPLAMSWANEICGSDAEERAVVLGIMNASGYAVHTWLPLLTYPAVEAPRFRRGFTFSTVAFGAQFGITGVVAFLQRWEVRRRVRVRGEVLGVGVDVDDDDRD
jgi:ACS family pantothenate transporter-like MFS transporter